MLFRGFPHVVGTTLAACSIMAASADTGGLPSQVGRVSPAPCSLSDNPSALPDHVAIPDRPDASRLCGAVVYENAYNSSGFFLATGAGGRVADDCYLVGIQRGVCEIYSNIYNGGSTGNTITLELWDGCPQGGGNLIATSAPFPLLGSAITTVTWVVSPTIPVGNDLWIAWTSPQSSVGPLISDAAEVGYTADAFGTDNCGGGGPSCSCYFGGSPYAGLDLTISAVEVPSACCLSDGHCADLLLADCAAAYGSWNVGEYCDTFVCPPTCPSDTIFGQNVVAPDDFWHAYTSEAGTGWLVYDNFTGLTDPICDLHFFGIRGAWTGVWNLCAEDPMTFEIKFYLDAGGTPGAEACSYTATLSGIDTGLIYPGAQNWSLYEYSTALSPCCVLTDGWISIQGVSDPSCRFLWMNGYGLGDGAYQWDGGSLNPIVDDLALCLTGASLELVPDAYCYSPSDVVTVDVYMSDVDQLIRGGQFFLEYDETKLGLISADPGDAPFTLQVFECSTDEQTTVGCTPAAGLIDYAVGIPFPGGTPTSADTVMARIQFSALTDVCMTPDLVTFRPHDPPTRLTDEFGGEVLPVLVDMPVVSFDGTPPTISSLSVAGGTVDGDCEVTITFSATITDDCCLDSDDVVLGVTVPGGNATVSDVVVSKAQVGLTQVDVSGSALISGLLSCPATVQVSVDASDCCGNAATPVQASTDLNDTIDPVIHDCPSDIAVNADAGGCSALVTWVAPTATDNCTVASFTSTHSPGDSFPQGTTTVTYTAIDQCGNDATCSFDVTVNAFNDLVVSLELSPNIDTGGTFPQTLTRCITFVLWECGGSTSVTVEKDVAFTVTSGVPNVAIGTATLTDVPCGSYECITARDKLHTLRRTLDAPPYFDIVGTQYVADFVSAGKDLVGGNLNDDFWIDILDFGVFSSQWSVGYGSGDTLCGVATFPHADISGDGVVTTGDFPFIQINFLDGHEANCCGQPNLRDGGGGPITAISIAELIETGRAELAVGDLNGDGWLDAADVTAFMNGVRPKSGDPAIDVQGAGLNGGPPARSRP